MSADTPITADALTTLLHKRAEEKLRKEVEAMLPKLGHADPLVTHVTLPRAVVSNLMNNMSENKCWLPALIVAAREGIFAARVEEARAKEVADFLAKVETTATELDAIREEMYQ